MERLPNQSTSSAGYLSARATDVIVGDSRKPEFEEPPTRSNKAQGADVGQRSEWKINCRRSVERDQAKVGFTGLLLALAGCVAVRTQEFVHETLQKTRTSDVNAWIKTKFGATVGLKRRIAYQAAKASLTNANKSKSETSLSEGKSETLCRLPPDFQRARFNHPCRNFRISLRAAQGNDCVHE